MSDLKGPITLEPPYNFSEPYQSSIVMAGMTHPPKLPLAETAI